jgi:hypothetical protein
MHEDWVGYLIEVLEEGMERVQPATEEAADTRSRTTVPALFFRVYLHAPWGKEGKFVCPLAAYVLNFRYGRQIGGVILSQAV